MLRRLSGHPVKYMQTRANSRDSGMMRAVKSAARTLRRKTSSTVTTITKPVEQHVGNRVQRALDQVRTVVDGDDPHAWRQSRGVELVHRGPHAGQHLARVLAAPHEDDPLHPAGAQRLVVHGEDPGLGQLRHPHAADVANEDGYALRRVQDDVLQIVVDWMRPEPRIGSDCCPMVEQGAAGVAVVALHRVGDLAHAQAVLVERAGSIWTSYWRTCPPNVATSATPGT